MTSDTYDARQGARQTEVGALVAAMRDMTGHDLMWRQRGACTGLDPTIFFPDSEELADEAKSICAECPVRLHCLEHALARRERDGIWGGTTEKERRRIIRQRRRPA